jgi:hypothetical protein
MKTRPLALRRQVLSELSVDDLRGVAGGTPTEWSCGSCMTYESCYLTECLVHTFRTCADPA